MSLDNVRELENARAKLLMLEKLHQETQNRSAANVRVRDMSLRSIGRRIMRLSEVVAAVERRQSTALVCNSHRSQVRDT